MCICCIRWLRARKPQPHPGKTADKSVLRTSTLESDNPETRRCKRYIYYICMLLLTNIWFFALPLTAASAIYSLFTKWISFGFLANVFLGRATKFLMMYILYMVLVFTKKKGGTKLFFYLNVLSQGLKRESTMEERLLASLKSQWTLWHITHDNPHNREKAKVHTL